MGQLEDMHVFVRVVETGSITKAAEQLNLAKSAVSKRLSELENRLNSKLINRTTRKSSLTEAGTLYYQQVKLILEEVDELNNRISSATQHLEGSLKLALPLSFGLSQLAPALDLFAKKYPNLKIEIDFSDRKVDIVEEGFDLAFRIGHIEDSSLRARKIAPIKHILCGSPEYLDRYGKPEKLEELKRHRLLKYGSSPLAGITLLDRQGKQHTIQIEPYHTANNGDFLKSMAISGHGIALLPTFIIWKELGTKSLIPLLTNYSVPLMHAYALYPQTRFLPTKVRYLIDFLTERFGNNPYWDQA